MVCLNMMTIFTSCFTSPCSSCFRLVGQADTVGYGFTVACEIFLSVSLCQRIPLATYGEAAPWSEQQSLGGVAGGDVLAWLSIFILKHLFFLSMGA